MHNVPSPITEPSIHRWDRVQCQVIHAREMPKHPPIEYRFARYPQRIAVTRPLYRVQAPEPCKSSTSDSPPLSLIAIKAKGSARFRTHPDALRSVHNAERLLLHCSQTRLSAAVLWHGFWLRGVQPLPSARSVAPTACRPRALPNARISRSSRTTLNYHHGGARLVG